MDRLTFRMSDSERKRLDHMAQSSGKTIAAFLRELIFSSENIQSRIDFFGTINNKIENIQKQGLITNQIVYQLLVQKIGEVQAENLVTQIESYLNVKGVE